MTQSASRPSPGSSLKGLRAGGPLITVVIPCYNQAHFLGEAIGSVLAQSYRRFEVVVVDDGSTDNTSEVASRHGGARLIRQENRGLSGARNRGLAEAKGEYVVFLDADDRLLPGALEAGLGCFEERPECALVAGRHRLIAADGSLLKRQPPRQPPIGSDLYYTLLSREYWVIPGAVMYRRSVFDSVGSFDTSLGAHEDYDLNFRIARRFPVYHHGEMVLEYRRHGCNMTRNPGLMLWHTLTVLRRQREHVKGNERYEEAHKAGTREAQERYGTLLAERVQVHLREREWVRSLGGIFVLARFYPWGLALVISERRLERQRLARRLQNREQQLRDRTQELEELEGEAEQYQKVQRLRQQVQQLNLQIQNLNRQLQEAHNAIAHRRLPERGRWLSKVLGR